MTTLEKLMFLRGVDLFRQFTVEDLHRISEIAREEELASGQSIFKEGDRADRLYVLIDGNVSLFTEKSGQFHLVTMLGERDCFGEIALLDGGAHPASARVDAPGRALTLDRDETLDLLHEYPTLSIAFLVELAQTIRRMQARIQLLEDAMAGAPTRD